MLDSRQLIRNLRSYIRSCPFAKLFENNKIDADSINLLRSLTCGPPVLRVKFSDQLPDERHISTAAFGSDASLRSCRKCGYFLSTWKRESMAPYLYCPRCSSESHPIARNQRIRCDDTAYRNQVTANKKKRLAVKAYGILLIESLEGFRQRLMTTEKLERWDQLEEIRRECIEGILRRFPT